MYVTSSCSCDIPTTKWRDLSWGATYMQIKMPCVAPGEYYLHILSHPDLLPQTTTAAYTINGIYGAGSSSTSFHNSLTIGSKLWDMHLRQVSQRFMSVSKTIY